MFFWKWHYRDGWKKKRCNCTCDKARVTKHLKHHSCKPIFFYYAQCNACLQENSWVYLHHLLPRTPWTTCPTSSPASRSVTRTVFNSIYNYCVIIITVTVSIVKVMIMFILAVFINYSSILSWFSSGWRSRGSSKSSPASPSTPQACWSTQPGKIDTNSNWTASYIFVLDSV